MRKSKIYLVIVTSILLVLNLAVPMMTSAEESILDLTPVAYYSFDDADDLGRDYSGNGNDLIVYEDTENDGAVGVDAAPNATLGNSLKLDGLSVLASSVDENDLDFTDGLEAFTISLFLRNDATFAGSMRVLSSGVYGNAEGIFLAHSTNFWNNTDYMQQTFFGVGGLDWWTQCYRGNWMQNTEGYDHNWVLATMVCTDAGETILYMNGEQYGAAATGSLTIGSDAFPFAIGGTVDNAGGNMGENFLGLVDEVRIYDSAFSAAQVAELKAAYDDGTITGTGYATDVLEKTPVAYYSFDDDSDYGYDYSGNGNHLIAYEDAENDGALASDDGALSLLGNSLRLDGLSVLASSVDENELDFTDELGPFTISLFLRNDATFAANMRVLSSGVNGNAEGIFLAHSTNFWNNTDYMQQTFFGVGGLDWWTQCYRGNWKQNTEGYDHNWAFATLVRTEDDETILYMNGEQFGASASGTLDSSSDGFPFSIGGSVFNDGSNMSENFVGLVDEVRIYNSAFTAQEVTEMYLAYNNGDIAGTDPIPSPTDEPTTAPTEAQVTPTTAPSEGSPQTGDNTAVMIGLMLLASVVSVLVVKKSFVRAK